MENVKMLDLNERLTLYEEMLHLLNNNPRIITYCDAIYYLNNILVESFAKTDHLLLCERFRLFLPELANFLPNQWKAYVFPTCEKNKRTNALVKAIDVTKCKLGI